MATTKTGLDYFPLNVNFFDADKTQLISAHYGMKGENIMLRLLCKVYDAGYYYRFGEDELLLFTKRIGDGCRPDFVSEVLNELLGRDFFSKELFNKYQVLTSAGIQKRYFEATARRKRVEVYQHLLLVDTLTYGHVYICGGNEYIIAPNDNILPQSKGKERKLKEREREASRAKNEDMKYTKTKSVEVESVEVENVDPNSDYGLFLSWLKANAPYCSNKKNFPHQITEQEFCKLKENYTGKELAFVIELLENRKDLRNRYSNLYRTVLNWAKREYGN